VNDLGKPREQARAVPTQRERGLRSTVATPFATVTLRSFVPEGTYVSTPLFVSAAVGPRSSWRSPSCAVEPGRETDVICSPCRNQTSSVCCELAAGAEAVAAKTLISAARAATSRRGDLRARGVNAPAEPTSGSAGAKSDRYVPSSHDAR
jgi:hypothetical protein